MQLNTKVINLSWLSEVCVTFFFDEKVETKVRLIIMCVKKCFIEVKNALKKLCLKMC